MSILKPVACSLAAAACLFSCGSADTPSLVSLERQRVLSLVSRAVGEPPAADVPLRVRWNPAPCDCAAFETLVDGEWLRAEVNGTTPEADAVLAPYEATPDAPPWEWSAAGRIKPGKVVSCGKGQSALVVEVRWLGQGDPPPLP
jgi:hypothetical protein